MIQLPTLLCPLQPFIEFFPKFDSSSNLEMLENLISVATLIRAYLVEKNGEKNSRSYMFIRDCRVCLFQPVYLFGTLEYVLLFFPHLSLIAWPT